MSTLTPNHFAPEVRHRLAHAEVIQIERRQSPGCRTTIWAVVADEDVYVRSVRGPEGRWYQDLTAYPLAALHLDGQRIAVRAVPVTDDATITRVSEAYRLKYSDDPFLSSVLRDEVVPATLRLEPQ